MCAEFHTSQCQTIASNFIQLLVSFFYYCIAFKIYSFFLLVVSPFPPTSFFDSICHLYIICISVDKITHKGKQAELEPVTTHCYCFGLIFLVLYHYFSLDLLLFFMKSKFFISSQKQVTHYTSQVAIFVS